MYYLILIFSDVGLRYHKKKDELPLFCNSRSTRPPNEPEKKKPKFL